MKRGWTTAVALAALAAMDLGCVGWDIPDWPPWPAGMCAVPDNEDGKHPDRVKPGPCDAGIQEDAIVVDDMVGGDDSIGSDGSIDGLVGDEAEGGYADNRVDGEASSDGGAVDAGNADVIDVAVVDGDSGADGDGASCDVSRSPVDTPCVIDDRFGVFVSPRGSDTGSGTQAGPYKTLGKALVVAKSSAQRVYACDDGTGYPDALTVDATLDGISLYGGFECAGWTYATTRRAKVNPATGVALTVKGLTVGLTVEDFEFDAADAMGTTGESSIAAIVESTKSITLRRVRLVANKGAPGPAGSDGVNGEDGLAVDVGQLGGKASCPGLGLLAGGSWSSASSCGSRGGPGGAAYQGANGGNGIAGTPNPAGVDNGGPRGMPGGAGSAGVAGASGQQASTAGTFGASGYTAASAAGSGTDGSTGQGGGGGGASDGIAMCTGASGGAGGMGGCGGKAGTGGGGGGASVALLSWSNTGLVLDGCVLVASSGGAGGRGGNGGLGGLGQDGANGGASYGGDAGVGDAGSDAGPTTIGGGGKGGRGGDGGNGGPGAGGNGGPSYAIVYKSASPGRSNGTTFTLGAGGTKGVGGMVGNVKAPDGIAGSASEEFGVP